MKKFVVFILIAVLSIECAACGIPIVQKPKESTVITTHEESTVTEAEASQRPATVSDLASELSAILSENQENGRFVIDNTENSIIVNGMVNGVDSFVENLISNPDYYAKDWKDITSSINLYESLKSYVEYSGFEYIDIIQNVVGENTETVYVTYTNGKITYNILDEIPKTVWYGEGMYKVGKDIQAGEYFIKQEGKYSAYMAVYSDSTGNSILENENFDTFHYITIEDGQYFEVTRGKFTSSDDLKLTYDPYNLVEGMYKVGVDIPAGEYYLECVSDYSAYECVYDNSFSNRNIKTNDNFNSTKYITVNDGDYLLLARCIAKLVE